MRLRVTISRLSIIRRSPDSNMTRLRAKILRSHSGFATVADGFDRTSFHGFLAKRLLLRGGRLLKHIGVAAVVAAPEISGCGFPAQVAINTLRFEDLKTLIAAMVEATQRNEVGALNYEWAISDD